MKLCDAVEQVPQQRALPRRPLTVGELLDAAVQLVRERPAWLVPLAVGLAVAEQATLYPIRRALGVDFLTGFDNSFWDVVFGLWVVLAIGLGFEAFIITFLGPWAAQLATADLVGASAEARQRTPVFLPGVLVAAPIAGISTGIGAFFGPLWFVGYTLFGVSGAVIGLERRGPFRALGRAAGLAFRGGMRVTGVRLLGYFAWLLLRVAFTVGVIYLLGELGIGVTGAFWILTIGFVISNAAAYTFLAALDAATLVESRFRSEGLDIWLTRAERHGPLTHESVAG